MVLPIGNLLVAVGRAATLLKTAATAPNARAAPAQESAHGGGGYFISRRSTHVRF